MRLLYQVFLFSICIIICSSSLSQAQEEQFYGEYELLPDRKNPSMFRRPKKDSPAEQLEYANLLLSQGKTKKAEKQYRALVHEWRDAPEAPQAQLSYARLLEERGKHDRAFNEYQYLIDSYTGEVSHDQVLDRQFRIANHVMTRRGFRFIFFRGFEAPERALPLFEKIVRNAPNWERAPEAQFKMGLINEQLKDYLEAAAEYEVVYNKYMDSDYAPTAGFRRSRCYYIASSKRSNDEGLCLKAISALSGFAGRYNNDPNRPEALEYLRELKERRARMYFEQALFYDKMRNKPKAALIAYGNFVKKFPQSSLVARAAERIEILNKELENDDK